MQDCGRCPSCLQKKANRLTNRIINSTEPGEVIYFATLTYSNDNVPFFLLDELNTSTDVLTIYREGVALDNISVAPVFKKELTNFHPLNNDILSFNRVGVAYYKDVQDFIKRFKEYFQYHFGPREFKYFICSEYGGESQRPHFHLLFWDSRKEFDKYREAFFASWQFHDMSKLDPERTFEVARNVASYVASYVNCASYVSPFLRSHFPTKHSFSRSVGVGFSDFKGPHLVDIIERNGYFEYCYKTSKQGVPVLAVLQIPAYALSRYFPKFKGHNRLDSNSLALCASQPARLISFIRQLGFRPLGTRPDGLDDLHLARTALTNASKRLCNELGYEYNNAWQAYYGWLYTRAIALYGKTTLKYFYTNPDRIELESYDNISEIKGYANVKFHNTDTVAVPKVSNESLEALVNAQSNVELDCNNFQSVRRTDAALTDLFNQKDKSKKVTNFILSQTINI